MKNQLALLIGLIFLSSACQEQEIMKNASSKTDQQVEQLLSSKIYADLTEAYGRLDLENADIVEFDHFSLLSIPANNGQGLFLKKQNRLVLKMSDDGIQFLYLLEIDENLVQNSEAKNFTGFVRFELFDRLKFVSFEYRNGKLWSISKSSNRQQTHLKEVENVCDYQCLLDCVTNKMKQAGLLENLLCAESLPLCIIYYTSQCLDIQFS